MPKKSNGSAPSLKKPSLSWHDRINAIIRNSEYQKDSARFLKACQQELLKYPKAKRDQIWITHFFWDHQNPVAKKWGLPWFIDPTDRDQVDLPLLAVQEKQAKWGASLSTPKVIGVKERRWLVLEVDLAERKNDLMASLEATVTYYRKFFQFHGKDQKGQVTEHPTTVDVKDERFLILEVDLAAHHKETMADLDTTINFFRQALLFHYGKEDFRKKSTKADPWHIWDQVHIHKKILNALAKERAGSSKNPAYDKKVNKEYQVVRNALHQAKAMIQQAGRF